MEYDKKPNVIKYEGSKLQATQQLIDELRVKIGQPKYEWTTELNDNVSVTNIFNELVDGLNGLKESYETTATGCEGTYYGSVKNGKTSTYNGCSSNKSSVNNRNCSGGYDFGGCNCYNIKD